MSALQQVKDLLPELTQAEKAQVIEAITADWKSAAVGIEKRPGVCGGEACIVRTRIPVWLLEQARRLGTSEAELLHSFPTLRAEDLAHAWAYVQAHVGEVDRAIADNEQD